MEKEKGLFLSPSPNRTANRKAEIKCAKKANPMLRCEVAVTRKEKMIVSRQFRNYRMSPLSVSS